MACADMARIWACGVVAEIHVKGRTGTAGNSQDLRTYQTEKSRRTQNTRYAQCKYSASTRKSIEVARLVSDS